MVSIREVSLKSRKISNKYRRDLMHYDYVTTTTLP